MMAFLRTKSNKKSSRFIIYTATDLWIIEISATIQEILTQDDEICRYQL